MECRIGCDRRPAAGVGTAGDAAGDKFYGIEGLEGSNYADTLTGDGQGNTLYGWGGNDLLLGEGDAYIMATTTSRVATAPTRSPAAAAYDWLLGNAGRDVFRFDVSPLKTRLDNGAGIAGVDTLADFSAAEDRIALETSAFGFAPTAYDAWGSPVDGVLSASAFKLGTSATTTAHRIVYDQASGAIYFDADGFGGKAQVQFAKVAAGTALTAAHFQLITL